MQGLWWNTTTYAWKLERETVIIASTIRNIWIDHSGDMQISLKAIQHFIKKSFVELFHTCQVSQTFAMLKNAVFFTNILSSFMKIIFLQKNLTQCYATIL